MKSWISYFILLSTKYLTKLFYKYQIGWPKERIKWDEIKLIILLNHTSLFEFLYVGVMPNSFLHKLSKRMVAPAADKTMNRPIVGLFFKLFNPGIMSITRKRDETWTDFLDSIYDDSVILIVPEGRMKRADGMDVSGNKMNIRSGILDILMGLQHGKIAFAYSGGLHHVQIPDKSLFPNLFKTLKMNLEVLDIDAYKTQFSAIIGSERWKENILNDLQFRLENKTPI